MYDNNPPADPYADSSYPPPEPRNGGSGRGRDRSRSASPAARARSPPRRRSPPPRPRGVPNAQPSSVLGVFGLSIRTQERDLDEEFSRYGKVEKVTIVYDQRSDRSRGFGFIKMSTADEAARCITELNGLDLNGRRIRVDYSTTERPHAPTPGEYMGHRRPEYEDRRRRDDRGDSYHGRDWKDRRDHRDRDRERDRDYRDRDRDREHRDRDRDHRDRDRDRRSPARRSPSPTSRRGRHSYSRSPPRGSGSSPTRERRDENGRW
ncbi:Transformer-2 protein homolog beta OS=Bos taurus GN=TRA2B PE=2 SV=1 [Rhizoctonia solani AG-1 IB]|uniref:Transformer-2 protein homolog beta n=2 Tax=Rhizoctonia solani TaxID=456999 RepID=M5BKB9_THACB|nr:unnamed protein product [Rhizoctonia solani]CCO26540.1 Transformer-2 protein homolog beta Short=TRA-2 beta [Rhizoctonia solani AG-1 IB]CEL59463.1 Transformer-2 protein homolog beta OS=Bos taurus GN=TRA2B PE=2 SV=1 [Rhizoctonia solani AG-1 IB]